MLCIATSDDRSQLVRIYGQFLHSSTLDHNAEFFSSFLSACIPLTVERPAASDTDKDFAVKIFQDMLEASPEVIPGRLTDYLLLGLGSATNDKMLVMETVEHLIVNFHLNVQAVHAIVDALLSVDEFELAKTVMDMYLENVTEEPDTISGSTLRTDVKLIDLILLEEKPAGTGSNNSGFIYKLEYSEGIVHCFERYFLRAPQTVYMIRERAKLQEAIAQLHHETESTAVQDNGKRGTEDTPAVAELATDIYRG
ncbi:DEKNAAC104079 [Brettanomyces naardenensis]|uniref:DEKNAAC104079 n=1 Tax=Brettanomyces naardenensis TaxID=13370 RepID=A0A448YQ19_BRENA|nr:DEKNAAC104079 [Brettanomyces naardenensis]